MTGLIWEVVRGDVDRLMTMLYDGYDGYDDMTGGFNSCFSVYRYIFIPLYIFLFLYLYNYSSNPSYPSYIL